MQFRDRTLLRLLDPDEQARLLTAQVGDRVLRVAFTADEALIGPVTNVVVRQVSALPVSWNARRLDAQMYDLQSSHQWRLSAEVPMAGPSVDADAQLDLTLVASRIGVASAVTDAQVEALHGIGDLEAVDARIMAEDGALPPEGPARQARRLTALRAVLDDRFETSDQAPLDLVLRQRGLTSFEGLQEHLSPPHIPQRLRLRVVEDATKPAADAAFKVQCLAYAVERPFDDLAVRLADIQVAAARVAANAEPSRPPAGTAVRAAVPALLLFPESALDDPDLPEAPEGVDPSDTAGHRAARLNALAGRLQHLGVVPVALP
ncbi:hypothetical protein [Streptomyces rhizosphaericus]|uniref:Uncharacterized protein n=1 Tax=Streptomyces rhizosphaericus TaxID=114699 RepID=A0A6G4AAK5_9ACTN|nr:hypothetical protein [Streptomyces rhizosphaericus]NEW69874.1 hypothetical protein [Streptomyces rhizosphaericus]